ncbi:hypothetical protein GE061_008130 [Apolygus lucorum]|uniref:Uncharacterized protein n=1 Tax=Apolygus lucorum TaxID=248454 RepID=A0A8S9WNL7_APOLU|nr:hypothetical protein GE061_008130 [Apolygus lucorum]
MKVFKLPDSRLPRILGRECLKCNVFWAKNWDSLIDRYGIAINKSEDVQLWSRDFPKALEVVADKYHEQFMSKALVSERHQQYRELRTSPRIVAQILGSGPIWVSKWLFKLRGDILALRSRPYEKEEQTCPMCSANAIEDAFHFTAQCTAYTVVRRKFLGASVICREEYMYLLERAEVSLARYCRVAWQLHVRAIAEYNL